LGRHNSLDTGNRAQPSSDKKRPEGETPLADPKVAGIPPEKPRPMDERRFSKTRSSRQSREPATGKRNHSHRLTDI
jgi:hypothetical protein